MQWRKSWLPLLLLILLSGIPHPLVDLLQGHSVSHTVDQMFFSRDEAYGPYDLLQADGTLQFQVWRKLVFESWARGEAPFWNPYVLAGTPLLANSQSGALYPPHIVVGLVHLPVNAGVDLLAWFHFALAALGIRALALKLGAKVVPAFAAGLSFAGSSFMQAWMPLASVISTAAWIPWLLVAVAETFDPTQQRWYRLPAFAGMMLFAGHLQFAAYGFVVAAICGLFWAASHWHELNWARRTSWVLGIALGVGLAMPQLLPVLTFSKNSHRQGAPTDEGYAAYVKSAIPAGLVLSRSVFPMAQGTNTVTAGESSLPKFWPSASNPALNYAETAVTVGPLALLGIACVCAARTDWKKIGGLIAASLIALLLMTGSPLNRLLYFGLPGWSATGSPGRAMVVFLVCTVVFGAVAVSNVDLGKMNKTGKALLVGIPTFIIACAWILMMQLPTIRTLTPEQVGELFNINIPVAFFSLICVATALFWPHVRDSMKWKCMLLIAPVIGLNWSYSIGIKTYPEVSDRLPRTDARVAIINAMWPPTDLKEGLAPPNIAAVKGIRQVGGYDSLLDRDTVALLKDINGQDPAPLVNGNMMLIKPGSDLIKLAEAGVTEVWTRYSIRGLEQKGSKNGVLQYEIPGAGRAYTPTGKAEFVSESLTSLTLKANGPGVLSLRDRNLPGWTATVDGKEVQITGAMWREVELPAGIHEVVFRYVPPGYTAGIGIFALSLVVTVAVSLGFSRYRTLS